jgi:molybdate-binding protein
MTSIHLDTQDDKYLISLDKASFDKEWLMDLIERLRMEELARKFNFDEDSEQLGEDIKSDWWNKNKSRFINE